MQWYRSLPIYVLIYLESKKGPRISRGLFMYMHECVCVYLCTCMSTASRPFVCTTVAHLCPSWGVSSSRLGEEHTQPGQVLIPSLIGQITRSRSAARVNAHTSPTKSRVIIDLHALASREASVLIPRRGNPIRSWSPMRLH